MDKKPVGGVRIHRPNVSTKPPLNRVFSHTTTGESNPLPPMPLSPAQRKTLRLPEIVSDVSNLLPLSTRPLGIAIAGQTGMGKSTLLEQLIKNDMENGITCIVMDAHGDLSSSLLAYASILMSERTILLEVKPDTPFGLNIYECPDLNSIIAIDRTVDTVVQLFRKQWGEDRLFFPRIEYVIKNTARTILANPQYTMLEIPLLFRNEQFRNTLVANVRNSEVLQFWADYQGRSPYLRNELTESSILRISQFLQSEFIQRVVSQSHTTIPFSEVFSQNGQLLLINLPIGKLGEGVTGFLGSVFLSVLTNLIYEREKLPMSQRGRVHLYLDEYGRFASATTAALLREGRKFNIGTTVAFQTLSDLKDEENRSAVMQTGSTCLFQIIGEDAAILAPEFAQPPQDAWEEELEPERVEIRRPQRHERVEEQVAIEVEEDIQEISQNPFDFLVGARGTHGSRAVREITQRTLMPVIREQEKTLISNILAVAMEPNYAMQSLQLFDMVSEIVRLHFNFPVEWFGKEGAFIQRLISKTASPIVIEAFTKEIITCEQRKYMENFREGLTKKKGLSPYDPVSGSYRILTAELIDKQCEYERRHSELVNSYIPSTIEKNVKELISLVSDLMTLCEELAKEPIMVPTGQKRMVKRIQPHITYLTHESEKINHPRIAITHPQRTYADMVNEKAQELANLPRFTCMIQSIDSQGQAQRQLVKLPPPTVTAEEPTGLNQIIANSARYYRKWEEIEQEIQKRQYIQPIDTEKGNTKAIESESKLKKPISRKRTLQE